MCQVVTNVFLICMKLRNGLQQTLHYAFICDQVHGIAYLPERAFFMSLIRWIAISLSVWLRLGFFSTFSNPFIESCSFCMCVPLALNASALLPDPILAVTRYKAS